jgi:hypothetical protein
MRAASECVGRGGRAGAGPHKECERRGHVSACAVGGERGGAGDDARHARRAARRGRKQASSCGARVACVWRQVWRQMWRQVWRCTPGARAGGGPGDVWTRRDQTRSRPRPCNRPTPAHRRARINSCPRLLVALCSPSPRSPSTACPRLLYIAVSDAPVSGFQTTRAARQPRLPQPVRQPRSEPPATTRLLRCLSYKSNSSALRVLSIPILSKHHHPLCRVPAEQHRRNHDASHRKVCRPEDAVQRDEQVQRQSACRRICKSSSTIAHGSSTSSEFTCCTS